MVSLVCISMNLSSGLVLQFPLKMRHRSRVSFAMQARDSMQASMARLRRSYAIIAAISTQTSHLVTGLAHIAHELICVHFRTSYLVTSCMGTPDVAWPLVHPFAEHASHCSSNSTALLRERLSCAIAVHTVLPDSRFVCCTTRDLDVTWCQPGTCHELGCGTDPKRLR